MMPSVNRLRVSLCHPAGLFYASSTPRRARIRMEQRIVGDGLSLPNYVPPSNAGHHEGRPYDRFDHVIQGVADVFHASLFPGEAGRFGDYMNASGKCGNRVCDISHHLVRPKSHGARSASKSAALEWWRPESASLRSTSTRRVRHLAQPCGVENRVCPSPPSKSRVSESAGTRVRRQARSRRGRATVRRL